MTQLSTSRTFTTIAELIDWAIYAAWSSRSTELSIVPGAVVDCVQSYSVYLKGGVKLTLRAKTPSATRYTASVYVYPQS